MDLLSICLAQRLSSRTLPISPCLRYLLLTIILDASTAIIGGSSRKYFFADFISAYFTLPFFTFNNVPIFIRFPSILATVYGVDAC